jgi:hypothetical protein
MTYLCIIRCLVVLGRPARLIIYFYEQIFKAIVQKGPYGFNYLILFMTSIKIQFYL